MFDALRVDVSPEQASHMESFAIYFPMVLRDETVLRLHWGHDRRSDTHQGAIRTDPVGLVQRPPYACEMVIAVPHGVILEQELASDWSIRVKRHESCTIEVVIA
jgi:hypothetical protein